MSASREPMSYREASARAQALLADLAPYCERVEVAGSIRRGKPWINDIEIVAIPRVVPMAPVEDLFGVILNPGATERDNGFVNVVKHYADTIVKGDPATDKYIQFLTRTGVKVDLFTAHKDNWGYIFAIRTGSAEFSKGLAHRWVKLGYNGEDGMLMKYGKPIPVREERDLFALLKLPYVQPTDRA